MSLNLRYIINQALPLKAGNNNLQLTELLKIIINFLKKVKCYLNKKPPKFSISSLVYSKIAFQL